MNEPAFRPDPPPADLSPSTVAPTSSERGSTGLTPEVEAALATLFSSKASNTWGRSRNRRGGLPLT